MNDFTIKQLRASKKELEQKLTTAVLEFERECGLLVDFIEVDREVQHKINENPAPRVIILLENFLG